MSCHTSTSVSEKTDLRVLLVGNPNVGKSVIFTRLTQIEVISANYTGTTVSYFEGILRYKGNTATLIDVPGVYTLKPLSEAEKVALDMLSKGADVIIHVLDASHLERNLELVYEMKDIAIPTVYVLNLHDVATRKGIDVDSVKLSEQLNAPVFSTNAVKNEGISFIKEAIFAHHPKKALTVFDQTTPKAIADEVARVSESKETLLDKVGDLTLRPVIGTFIAFLVLTIALGIIVGGGKALRTLLLLPLLNDFYIPFVTRVISSFLSDGLLFRLLVGEYGVLIKGVEWPFALILPYVFLFYLVFSFLEDSGYLPRLGVLMDVGFKKIGLPGSHIIPFMLGYGCAVPAILSTRTASSKKERIIAVTLISLAIPCTSQISAFILLLGDRSLLALLFVFLLSFVVMFLVGLLLKKHLKGKQSPLMLEIPSLLLPSVQTVFKKIGFRLKHFLIEAEIPMMIGILLAAFMVETQALVFVSAFLEPLVTHFLGLPKEASLPLFLGIIRRELTVMPLLEMDLTTIQMITGAVVALFYLPCISVFAVIIKEFNLRFALLIMTGTTVFAFLMGGFIRFILLFFTGTFWS